MTKVPSTNRSIFDQNQQRILERGLHSLSLACDALTEQNKQLNKDIQALKAKNARLEEKLLTL
jgi:predicted  nucleic acid-binding Zn-ribbon protein